MMLRSIVHVLLLAFLQFHVGAAYAGKKPITLEDIFSSSKFSLKTLSSVQWVDGGKAFSWLEVDTSDNLRDLQTYRISDGQRELVMDGSRVSTHPGQKPTKYASYEWSPDFNSILVSGTLTARRTKTGGNFGIFEVGTGRFRMLTDTEEEQVNIRFSPDGKNVGFVRSNNLYVMDVDGGEERQLTTDGSETILNGVFDWVYEEEFSIIEAWEWSPDGRKIAFWRLDQSAVPMFPLVHYPSDDGHAKIRTMRYPKAGDPNSAVDVGIVDVETGRIVWADLGRNRDIYVPRIQWTNNPATLSVQRLNRGQDRLDLMLVDSETGAAEIILTESDTAWIDAENGSLMFLKESDQFLWASFRDGYTHIYLYGLDGRLENQVTTGEWDVTQLAGVNEKRGLVYFIAAQTSPMERHVYSIKVDGTTMCRLTQEPGWHSANFSPDYFVFLDTYSAVDSPTSVSLRASGGTYVAPLVENSHEMLKDYDLGEHRFFTFGTTDGERLNGWMITPPDFDASKQYPVLLYVYGGPGSQTVTNSWGGTRYLWHQMLAGKGYIVASVDNRGTGARGKAFMQQTHRRVGLREVDDYIETVKYFSGLSYVDSKRIGIWGWSGGGFMTCLSMTYGAGHFKTGIAVAPVTDWKFYDTIYTERYMDTPERNPRGYRLTSALTYASNMEGNLLIIHGTMDDNVHWQNTITLVDELIRNKKQVQTMFYPGRTHGISGGSSTLHVYTLMTTYLLEHL